MTTSHPSAPDAPQFTIVRTFDAPQELVWRAWTEQAEFARWMQPFGVAADSVSLDVRVGGRYRYTMRDAATGQAFPTGGEYLEVEPIERLRFTWGDPDAPVVGAPVITIGLTSHGAGTELTFHLLGHAGAPGDGFVYDGWDEGLTNLGHFLAGEKRD